MGISDMFLGVVQEEYTTIIDTPEPSSTPAASPVSYAQHLLTFRIVYPPPPTMSNGLLNDLTNLTQLA